MKFRQKDGLKRHENAKHANKEHKPYPCDVCNKVLQSKYSLAFHKSKHTLKRESLKCDLCYRVFNTQKALEKHKMWVVYGQVRRSTRYINDDRFFFNQTKSPGWCWVQMYHLRYPNGVEIGPLHPPNCTTPSLSVSWTHAGIHLNGILFKIFYTKYDCRAEDIIFTCTECDDEFDKLEALGTCKNHWFPAIFLY